MFYPASLLLHLVIFGLWLGGEGALWRGAGALAQQPGAPALDTLVALATLPLLALAAMPAAGYQVGVATGDIVTSLRFVAITWVAFGGWALAAGIAIRRARQGRPSRALERFVFGFGVLMVPAFSYDCWDAIYAESHIRSDWVALKVQVYALLVGLGLWRLRVLTSLRAGRIDTATATGRVRFVALASAVLLVVAAGLAAWRPELG